MSQNYLSKCLRLVATSMSVLMTLRVNSLVIQAMLVIAMSVLMTVENSAIAHNKVVVIPMAGDDVPIPNDGNPAKLTPTAPVTNANTTAADYLGAFVVTDRVTKLQWQPVNASTNRVSWAEALELCATSIYLNLDNWRLPTVRELQSLVDYGEANPPLIVKSLFPNTQPSGYWSASRYEISSFAWYVGFDDGRVRFVNQELPLFVRCVH